MGSHMVDCFSAGNELHILVVKTSSEAIAIAPLMLAGRGSNGLRVRLLEFLTTSIPALRLHPYTPAAGLAVPSGLLACSVSAVGVSGTAPVARRLSHARVSATTREG